MAEVNNKHKRKGRKNNRNRFLCFFGSCFGISSKVSADHGGRKLVKDSNEYNSLGEKAVPFTNDQMVLTLSSEIKSSNGEILVIEEAEAHHQDDETIMLLDPPPTAHQVLINPKSKNLDESGDIETPLEDNNIGQERGYKMTKLSHAVSLPLPRPKKKKPTTDGGSKSKNGNELIMAAEFDSVVGALIIMVTLIVMLIWGKICATLCAAAWFYFFPRFRANINKSYLIKHKYDRDLVNFDSLGVQEKGGFTRII